MLHLCSICGKIGWNVDSGELSKLDCTLDVAAMFVFPAHICGNLFDGFVVNFGGLLVLCGNQKCIPSDLDGLP